jgi:hypothetical protein
VLYEGVNVEEPAISNDENNSNANEELRKKITSCMIQGKKRFHSSNNKGLLNNSIFEGVTTAKKWRDRVLGKSEMVEFDNELEYSLSGNFGIRLTADLSNRARIVNLLLKEEDANSRQFKNPDLHGWILDNRSVIISALYKLVENWIAMGKPKGSIPFASFPEWSNICGGIMEAAGYPNPCSKDDVLADALDPETDEMKQLFEACYNLNPNRWMTKEEIQVIVKNEGIMNYNFNERSDQTKFGIRIDKYRDRTFLGITMKVQDLKIRSSRRKFIFVKDTKNDQNSEKQPTSVSCGTQKIGNENLENNRINDQKGGNLATIGNIITPAIIAIERIYTEGQMLPKDAMVAITQPTLKTPSFPVENQQNLGFESLSEITQKANSRIKEVEPKTKKKSDRELQFYESPETQNIETECTKEQVLEWIKNNPGVGIEQLDMAMGLGSLKWATELVTEGKVRILNEGWEEINNVQP